MIRKIPTATVFISMMAFVSVANASSPQDKFRGELRDARVAFEIPSQKRSIRLFLHPANDIRQGTYRVGINIQGVNPEGRRTLATETKTLNQATYLKILALIHGLASYAGPPSYGGNVKLTAAVVHPHAAKTCVLSWDHPFSAASPLKEELRNVFKLLRPIIPKEITFDRSGDPIDRELRALAAKARTVTEFELVIQEEGQRKPVGYAFEYSNDSGEGAGEVLRYAPGRRKARLNTQTGRIERAKLKALAEAIGTIEGSVPHAAAAASRPATLTITRSEKLISGGEELGQLSKTTKVTWTTGGIPETKAGRSITRLLKTLKTVQFAAET